MRAVMDLSLFRRIWAAKGDTEVTLVMLERRFHLSRERIVAIWAAASAEAAYEEWRVAQNALTERQLAVLSQVQALQQEGSGATVSTLAQRSGKVRSQVEAHLNALEAKGWVRREQHGRIVPVAPSRALEG